MYGTIAYMPQRINDWLKQIENKIEEWIKRGVRLQPKRSTQPAKLGKWLMVFTLLMAYLFACAFPGRQQPKTPTAFAPVNPIPSFSPTAPPNQPGAGPVIRDITLNTSQYPASQVPGYEKLEITFQVDTSVNNLQLPYDPSPPPGIQPGIGISVDALFTPDNWQTVYQQPAFHYQQFQDSLKNDREWFYPTQNYSWKVRFSPNVPGNWQFKLVAQDPSGRTETTPKSFTVSDSDHPGFLRVSRRDARYFEFDDGSYFPALGYNMNYDRVSWTNPVLDNQANFEKMGQNGIQLIRVWLSQWSIYGPSWNPWNAIDPLLHSQGIPFSGLTFNNAYSGSETSLMLEAAKNPCMFLGFMKPAPAVLANTRYRVRIRYRTEGLAGPRVSGAPFGLVAKTGGWLWEPGNYCQDAGSGLTITSYQSQNQAQWQILEGSLETGISNFLPLFYLTLENVTQGKAIIDYVWIEEDLGNGSYGPNIVPKPWMSHHLYYEQRNSYAFDKVLELAEKQGIYLRLVVLEKNDWIFNRLDDLGQPILYDPLCEDGDPNNDPDRCPSNHWFYGNGREMTKVRWLQQAWWRYLQARWGYSTHIHSWELLNEGDPASDLHFMLADEFGKYMHQFIPNDHLVSTSNWHSFPGEEFWANPEYPNVDYADIHYYIDEKAAGFTDTAFGSYNLSQQIGAKQPSGAGKPVIRGEVGFVVSGSEPYSELLLADTQGIWLHNFIWAGINPGGMIESYWYEKPHIVNIRPNGTTIFDHRPQFRPFYTFIKDIPLSNGFYQDVRAVSSNSEIRILGQKDLTNGKAHLWIQNTQHSWMNVLNGLSITGLSGQVQIAGFQPNQSYSLQWWDPYEVDPTDQIILTEIVASGKDGVISIPVQNLVSDVAVQIFLNRAVNENFLLFLPAILDIFRG